jgi:hypothetical protein
MSAEPDRFGFEDDETGVEFVPVCASCGYPIEDDGDLVDTGRGEMHEHCAIRIYPKG